MEKTTVYEVTLRLTVTDDKYPYDKQTYNIIRERFELNLKEVLDVDPELKHLEKKD